jgi:hypothetical protein
MGLGIVRIVILFVAHDTASASQFVGKDHGVDAASQLLIGVALHKG